MNCLKDRCLNSFCASSLKLNVFLFVPLMLHSDGIRTHLKVQVNNGRTMDDGEGRKLADLKFEQRHMKAKTVPLVDDFKLDIAIDGLIVKTMELDEYMECKEEIAYNEAIFVLLDNENVYDTSDSGAELTLRIRSDGRGRNTMSISHIYYD